MTLLMTGGVSAGTCAGSLAKRGRKLPRDLGWA
jgi:hypothetical protein